MARPAKTLHAHVRDGSFRARREQHRHLLAGAALEWPAFASLQGRYTRAGSEPEQRALALEFERLVTRAQFELQQRIAGSGPNAAANEIAHTLALLGKAGSVKQLLGFFPAYLVHSKGPLLGQPFRLEAW